MKMLKKFILLVVSFLWFSSKAQERATVENNFSNKFYEVIETKEYNESVLFYKTMLGEELKKLRLNYESLNQNNYDKNWALEIEQHINFDTIFNKEQQSEINKKIESLKSVVLEPNRLQNPDILYKPEVNSKGARVKKIGLEKISFPFFQEGKNGDLFAFIYRENPTHGIFYVYKLTNGKWKEFSKLQVWIA